MTTKRYLAPRTLDEVMRIAAESGVTILAGGTDLHLRWSRKIVTRPGCALDVKGVDELRGIDRADGEITVGACTVMSDLETDPVIRTAAPMLAEAASRVACPQIRNRATLGGNLCNASPAADTAVPLILLDAKLQLTRSCGDGVESRSVRITDFFRGPGVTCLTRGEALTRICFEPMPAGSLWAWEKFGTRPAMEIAVASVGVLLTLDDGTVTRARVGYGSVAPTPLRGRCAEAELVGHRLNEDVIGKCIAAACDEIAPITDGRASEAYRRRIVGVLLRRMLQDAGRP